MKFQHWVGFTRQLQRVLRLSLWSGSTPAYVAKVFDAIQVILPSTKQANPVSFFSWSCQIDFDV